METTTQQTVPAPHSQEWSGSREACGFCTSGRLCEARLRQGLICTRERGHEGAHVACGTQHFLDIMSPDGRYLTAGELQASEAGISDLADLWIGIVERQARSRRQRLQADAQNSRARYMEHMQHAISAARNASLMDAEAAALQRMSTNHEACKRDWDAAQRIVGIKKVDLWGDNVQAITECITARNPRSGAEYSLGEYKITIDMSRGLIKIHNLTRTVDTRTWEGMHHPHIFAACDPCFGNASEQIAELVANYQLSDLLQVLLVWLANPNVDDSAGATLGCWPRADGGTPEGVLVDDDEEEEIEDEQEEETEEEPDDEDGPWR